MGSKIFKNITSEYKPFIELKNALLEKETPVSLYGLSAPSISFLLNNLIQDIERPLLILSYDPVRAKKIVEDLTYYIDEGVFYFPAREIFFFDKAAGSRDLQIERLKVMEALLNGEVKILVSTPSAVGQFLQDKSVLENKTFKIGLGDTFDLEELATRLIDMGYERVDIVEGVGQFSIRGGIVDFFGPREKPYRLEFFDQEIDSIRSFDPLTQRSIEEQSWVKVFPVQEILLSKKELDSIVKGLNRDLKKISKLDPLAQERCKDKYSAIIESIQEGQKPKNIDLVLPYIDKESKTKIYSYFQDEPIIFLDEPMRLEEVSKETYEEFQSNLADLQVGGEVFSTHKELVQSYGDFQQELKSYDLVILNSILRKDHGYSPKRVANFFTKTVNSFNGRIGQFKDELNQYLKKKYTIVLLGGNQEKSQRLYDNLEKMDFPVKILSEDDTLKAGRIYVGQGSVHGGFEIEDLSFVLLNSSEIFGTNKPRKKKKEKQVIDLEKLSYGDYLVHEAHGIGQFVGTNQLEVQGTIRDYLTIQYKGGDKIFIPMDQLSIIHKFTGSQESPPKVNRLNSAVWEKTKARAKKSVEEMADDLIELYAKRQSEKGHAFSPDTPWQREFEDAFEYVETEGQLESIEEIKADMENSKPMDRLLCADVGYGKTEVALRAAFKAIMDGKQVAILVPTTILAQQHYNTIIERFSAFPIRVGLLSRFRGSGQIKSDIEGIRKGSVELVVGTHRLLSKDVSFKDLGLLIIDEEQRFGVRHKEKLKLLKENVDTLTLTATPIPRTLQMSMVGIRDMSVIDEPPEERFPIQTYVVEYNRMMVRKAILHEIDRGGQVFFVYNRVQSMETMLYDLRQLVPEAVFAMANGQMSENTLEDTMLSFVEGNVDVLLCSTIIETGMDVSNANTIIIYEANRLGLSQLYQLRGRVGRSNRIAYAYFTFKKDTSISEVAEKRLRAISEFTEFGSGYKIAQRDLEIRGSGNILGESQHGHIDAIGYDFYVKMLKMAVSKRKGQEEIPEVEATIDIYLDAFIPKAYIKDEGQRMEMYRKIALVENDEDQEDILDELIDRYGDPSRSVFNLIHLSKLRHSASRLKIDSISQKGEIFTFEFTSDYQVDLALVNELTANFGKRIVFSFGEKPSFQLRIEASSPIKDLERVVDLLGQGEKVKKNKF